MKIVILFIPFLCFSLLLNAQDRAKGLNDRQQLLKTLVKGSVFKNGQTEYLWLPEIEAKKIESLSLKKSSQGTIQSKNDGSENSDSAYSDDEILEIKGPFIIFKKIVKGSLDSSRTGRENARSQSIENNFPLLPVVLNRNTLEFGIITGDLIVRVSDFNNAENISRKYNLKIYKKFPHLNTIIYKLHDLKNASQVLEEMRADSIIGKADFDILEEIKNPQ